MMGYELDQTELRLIPYVQYEMVNNQHLDINKISGAEREILKKWRDAGHLTGGASQMNITKEFWEYLCAILFLAYVDID